MCAEGIGFALLLLVQLIFSGKNTPFCKLKLSTEPRSLASAQTMQQAKQKRPRLLHSFLETAAGAVCSRTGGREMQMGLIRVILNVGVGVRQGQYLAYDEEVVCLFDTGECDQIYLVFWISACFIVRYLLILGCLGVQILILSFRLFLFFSPQAQISTNIYQ